MKDDEIELLMEIQDKEEALSDFRRNEKVCQEAIAEYLQSFFKAQKNMEEEVRQLIPSDDYEEQKRFSEYVDTIHGTHRKMQFIFEEIDEEFKQEKDELIESIESLQQERKTHEDDKVYNQHNSHQ